MHWTQGLFKLENSETNGSNHLNDCPGRCCQLHLRYNTDNTHCFTTLRPALRPLLLQLSKKRGLPSYAIFLSSPNDVSERNRSFPILMNFWSHNLVSIILTCVTSYISLLHPYERFVSHYSFARFKDNIPSKTPRRPPMDWLNGHTQSN